MLLLDLLNRWPVPTWIGAELTRSLSIGVDPMRPVPGSSHSDRVQHSMCGRILHRVVEFVDTDGIEGIHFDRRIGERQQAIREDLLITVIRFEAHNNAVVSDSAQQIAVLPVNQSGLVRNRGEGYDHPISSSDVGRLARKVASDLK